MPNRLLFYPKTVPNPKNTKENEVLFVMKILTSTQFKELDKYTIEHEPVSSADLMERAAKAIAAELKSRWTTATRFIVFAGPGNNGGDALAVSRLLCNAGYTVQTYLFNITGDGQAFQTCSPALRRYPYGDQGVRGQWIQSRS